MTQNLQALEEWAGALLAKLDASERRKLLGTMVRDLRRDQQKRIAIQRAPDGTPYEPRKPKDLRGKKGRIKAQMFNKLRNARHMRTKHTVGSMSVGFMGRAARIARVHQEGLKDRPQRDQAEVRYPSRELLGFSKLDVEALRKALLDAMI